MKRISRFFKNKNKGQSFIELALLMGTLMLLLTGMVEFGNMLNQYINLVDGAREGARFGSNTDPFLSKSGVYDYSTPQPSFFDDIDKVIEGDLTNPDVDSRTSAISPLHLDNDSPGYRDPTGEFYKAADVLISFYAVSNGNITRKWSKSMHSSGQISKISDAEVKNNLSTVAPSTGLLLVEIFYNYHQLLNLPFFTNVIANPVPLHAYAFMPLAAAEATPTP